MGGGPEGSGRAHHGVTHPDDAAPVGGAAVERECNTFGGEWYDQNWKAQLNSPAVTQAVNFYVNLVKQYGEPGASNDSFNQLLTLYGQGKCAMWYDATVAATSIASEFPQFETLGLAVGQQIAGAIAGTESVSQALQAAQAAASAYTPQELSGSN